MRRLFLALLLSLLSACSEKPAGKGAPGAASSPADFTREVAEIWRRADPSLTVEISGDLSLKVSNPARGKISSFLDNTYKLYQADPARKEEVVQAFIASGNEALAHGDKPIDRTRIVPVVKDRAWLADSRKALIGQGFEKPVENVFEDLNKELVVVYGEDSESGIRYFGAEDLAEIKIEQKDLRKLACENLEKLLPPVKTEELAAGYFFLATDGNFEASLLLLDRVWTSGAPKVKGETVVAIPARDTLLVTGSENKHGLERMRADVKKVVGEDPYRLSDKLFVYRDGKFEEYKE
ncbi:DUF1444 family protein [Luteolibacter soli]|uniref:DUF1444 family protein n=1 Tax=Luteolibacter soli TaxID=3135280 RepID=A0ABU9AWV9_9BACT